MFTIVCYIVFAGGKSSAYPGTSIHKENSEKYVQNIVMLYKQAHDTMHNVVIHVKS